MYNPLSLLIIGVLTLGLFAWVLWPKRGLLAWWQRSQLDRKRVLIEDALKYLYDCEYKSKDANIDNLSENLNIPGEQAEELIGNLEKTGLIISKKDQLHLTETGRNYALRVIRIHRIWERYLADETSIAAKDWHHEADLKEHLLSFEDANILASEMGNPVFDPHGDPIPSVSGEIPDYAGVALDTMEVGTSGIITHIEDEPHTVYLQILALGLNPGTNIIITEKTPEKIAFVADGERCILAPVFAKNVTVVRTKPHSKSIEEETKKYRRLTDLKPKETAVVSGISKACRGQQRQRLMDFGIVPGTHVTIEMQSTFGDPTAYRVLDAVIALRKEHAQHIYIEQQQ